MKIRLFPELWLVPTQPFLKERGRSAGVIWWRTMDFHRIFLIYMHGGPGRTLEILCILAKGVYPLSALILFLFGMRAVLSHFSDAWALNLLFSSVSLSPSASECQPWQSQVQCWLFHEELSWTRHLKASAYEQKSTIILNLRYYWIKQTG